ncbi:MAG: K+/H+ antiporter subunit F [Bradyrhizobium sp.]|jgi:multicomponent K+:H+ antiporter subunit F|uniref:K+/H+ antiporter subunit F n=1 Tax=Bradyrhizobium TaxID=374 RepID=UPI0004298C28|nr:MULTISPECIES: K+/H+ antiporter subunit F [Bradyrhizobium]KQT15801.1 cation:proton antiporter [Bradyrhizobium sp. Leaf396]
MIAASCAFAIIAIAASILLNVYRLIIGPDVTDRILALDTMVINAIGLIVVAGIVFGTAMYFEAALLFAMVGFVSTVAFCKFLLRGNVIE